MANTVPIGPGVEGIKAGLAWGRMRNMQDKVEWLEAELAKSNDRLLRELATSKGLEVALNTVVRELKAVEAGTLITRTVSDPSNRDGRNQLIENAAEDELNRLSGGKLRFTRRTRR